MTAPQNATQTCTDAYTWHPPALCARRYVKSRSDIQLAEASGKQYTNYCDPKEYLAGNKSALINPCGLIAWSYFNDTYEVRASGSGGGGDGGGRVMARRGPALPLNCDPEYS